MTTRSKEAVENCPVFIASQILGKKWMILVLQQLMTPRAEDGLRFSELQRSMEWISPKVLTQRLRELEENNLVDREVDSSEVPIKVSYSLTDKGEGLRPSLEEMQKWGISFGEEKTADCVCSGFADCEGCVEGC